MRTTFHRKLRSSLAGALATLMIGGGMVAVGSFLLASPAKAPFHTPMPPPEPGELQPGWRPGDPVPPGWREVQEWTPVQDPETGEWGWRFEHRIERQTIFYLAPGSPIPMREPDTSEGPPEDVRKSWGGKLPRSTVASDVAMGGDGEGGHEGGGHGDH